jgi:hypothetical protein
MKYPLGWQRAMEAEEEGKAAGKILLRQEGRKGKRMLISKGKS